MLKSVLNSAVLKRDLMPNLFGVMLKFWDLPCIVLVSSSVLWVAVWVCLFIFHHVTILIFCCVSFSLLLPVSCSVTFSSFYRSWQWLYNCDTKTRLWGFASCIVSMCLFCSFSSPLPQYDSRWWLSSQLSLMMPKWRLWLLHFCLRLIS